MKSPFTDKEMTILKEWRSMNFRKEEFQVLFHSYKCEDTGKLFEDDIFAELNYNQLINQYREKYCIPFTEQIISIRKKYDVPASKMSEILGFGANIYRQYENGEVPSQSNARLIQLADDPQEFKKLVEFCNSFDYRTKEKIKHRIQNVTDKYINSTFTKELEKYFFEACLPNTYTGYRVPSIEKFANMVIFFTNRLQPWKTKLNKLLFYADFEMYRQSGYSISGVQYRAITMGPVPNNFNSIFEYLSNNKYIEIHYIPFNDGGTGEQFIPNANSNFNSSLFSEKELAVLEQIAARFMNTSTSDLIEISHKEKGWIENKDQKNLINYKYSFDLVG